MVYTPQKTNMTWQWKKNHEWRCTVSPIEKRRFSDVFQGGTLPETNIAPENTVSNKDSSFPTTIFQGPCWFHWMNEHQTIPNPHNWQGKPEYDFGIFWICGKCIFFVFQNTELPRSLEGLEGTNCVGISGIKTTLSRGVSASKSCLRIVGWWKIQAGEPMWCCLREGLKLRLTMFDQIYDMIYSRINASTKSTWRGAKVQHKNCVSNCSAFYPFSNCFIFVLYLYHHLAHFM